MHVNEIYFMINSQNGKFMQHKFAYNIKFIKTNNVIQLPVQSTSYSAASYFSVSDISCPADDNIPRKYDEESD